MAHRFHSGQKLSWNGKAYLVLGRLGDGRVQLCQLETSELSTVAEGELLEALFRQHTLRFVLPLEEGKGSPLEERDLSEYPLHHQTIARKRLEAIAPLLTHDSPRITTPQLQGRILELQAQGTFALEKDRSRLSISTLRRWLKRYLESGRDPRALIPGFERCGGPQKTRLEAEVEQHITTVFGQYRGFKEAFSVVDLHALVSTEIEDANVGRPREKALPQPSLGTVYARARRVNLLKSRPRLGAHYQASERPFEPLERVEIDHWRSDLIVVDDADLLPLGRLTLTFALCATTRYPLGYYLGFEPPGSYALAECVHHMVLPKTGVQARYGTAQAWQAFGLPARVRVDNGWEFRSAGFQDAMAQLGVVVEYCPVQTPEFKGGIERSFRTLGQDLFHTLPGTTFSNLLERREKNYDSMREACIPLGSIDQILHHYLLEVYAERYHRGLGGIPARSWERALERGFSPQLPSSARELAVLLGETEARKLWHYGLDWEGLRYQSESLAILRTQLKGQSVQVKRVRGDLSRVYVRDPFEGYWLEVPVVVAAQEYASNLSVWKHRVVLNLLRSLGDKPNPAALGRAKRRIQDMVEQAYSQAPLRLRSKMGRWQTEGRPTRDLEAPERLEAPEPSPDLATQHATSEPSTPRSEAALHTPLGPGWDIVNSPLEQASSLKRKGKT